MSSQLNSLKDDIKTETRSKNLIVFGVKESNEDVSGHETSIEQVSNVLKACRFLCDLTKNHVYRLGKKTSNGKPRPIKICLPSEADKWELIKRINREKPDGVFARLDLTREEQDQDFQLRLRLREAREADTKNKYKIVKGKIVQIKE